MPASLINLGFRTFGKRLSLWSLFIAVLLPGILALGIITYFQYIETRKATEREILQVARAMSKTVDMELKLARSSLQALSVSNSLQAENWSNFYQELKRFDELIDLPHHIALTEISGDQVLNTLKPFGSPLGKTKNVERLQVLLATGKPSISDLLRGSTSGLWVILVDIPVSISGKQKHVLTMVVGTEGMQRILSKQGMPSEWLAAITDRKGTIVARSRDSERFVGQSVVPTVREAIASANEGGLETVNLDGIYTLTAFSRSDETGFTVVLGVPLDFIRSRALKELQRNAVAIGLVALASLLLVVWVGRRIMEPINALTQAARAAEGGELNVQVPAGGPDEIDRMANQFNRMLSSRKAVETSLREREAELEDHREHLEYLVKARTAELRVAKDSAESANIAKSAFLANMSHEMRTPLHQAIAMVGLMHRDPLTPKQANRLEIVEVALQRLLALIDAILELTRIESTQFEFVEEPFDVEGLVEEVLATAQTQAKAKQIQVVAEAIRIPFRVVGDRANLKLALLNYASNALRFTETGTIILRLMLVAETSDSVHLRFEVEDTGIGIAADDLPRLFSIFEQVDNSSTRKFGGLGVGLAITRKIAELMGGQAGCNSNQGEGSTFWFTVSLKKSMEDCSELEPG